MVSLWRRTHGDADQQALLSAPPHGWPADWGKMVNRPQPDEQEQAIAEYIARGRPFGTPKWVAAAAVKLGLETTLNPAADRRKRPKKVPDPIVSTKDRIASYTFGTLIIFFMRNRMKCDTFASRYRFKT